jgi:GNAT superfamily N-acetyltransferase
MAELYRLLERPPTSAEYRSLISAVGWAAYTNFDAADAALAHSLYHVVALHEDAVIGMARVVGDGAMFFYIQDVVVAPVHQGRGVGTLLLERVMGYLKGAAPEKAFIGLFAAEGTLPYYARFGFAVRMGLTGLFRNAPV